MGDNEIKVPEHIKVYDSEELARASAQFFCDYLGAPRALGFIVHKTAGDYTPLFYGSLTRQAQIAAHIQDNNWLIV